MPCKKADSISNQQATQNTNKEFVAFFLCFGGLFMAIEAQLSTLKREKNDLPQFRQMSWLDQISLTGLISFYPGRI